jgi:putative methyltransferase (TIGR04325 family)
MTIKKIAYDLTPPLIWRALSRMRQKLSPGSGAAEVPAPQYGASGDYASYAEAQRACAGTYHNQLLQEKTRELTAGIMTGTDISQLNIRLLAALQYCAARIPEPLDILDFGGAMGAHYIYLRRYLQRLRSWTVVEIEETAAIGNASFADEILRFTTELPESASFVLSSGAIQHTEEPYDTLGKLLSRGARYIVLDKVPLGERDRRTIQRVHPSVFGAEVAFPSYFFGARKFRESLSPYKVVMEWELPGYAAHLDGEFVEINRGFVLEKA